MQLLLDANISWRVLKLISMEYPGSLHVDKCELNVPAKDTNKWNYATKKNFTIVTNDEDFYELSIIKGFPPNVVLLKMGNQSTQFIADILVKHKEDIEKLLESAETGLLEIY